MASLASESALSFPGMPQWLGHQDTMIRRFGWVSRRGRIRLWKLSVKCWADPGFGSMIALTAAALSEKKWILLMLGKSAVRLDAIWAAFARAAISASKTSAWPPRPIFSWSISLPRR